MKKKLVVLTGAGMSAESGISTFRDSDGLWEKYRVEDVATPEGFAADPELVLNFYNQRRRELLNTKPNAGHIGLADLEQEFDVHIITQNIDNLHERAGSSHVIHLHGELNRAWCTACDARTPWTGDLAGRPPCPGQRGGSGPHRLRAGLSRAAARGRAPVPGGLWPVRQRQPHDLRHV